MIVLTGHAALKHIMEKKDVNTRLIRWIMLLLEFDYEIKDRKGSENPVADHLSRLVTNEASEPSISDCFPNEQLFKDQVEPWFAIIVNYLVTGEMPGGVEQE